MLFFTAAILTLLAAGFAAWPLLRGNRTSAAPRYEDAIKQLYRQRAAELVDEAPDAELREELTQDMGAVLLSEADQPVSEADASGQAARGGRAVLIALVCLIPLTAVGLYFVVAEPGLTAVQGAEEVMALDAESDKAQLEKWRGVLRQRVDRAPDDSKSWYLLGHSLLKLGQYGDAAEAFATTANLVGEDQTVKIYWLQARYLAARGVMDEVSRDLAQELLAANPNLSPVLELLALDAFRTGDGPGAVNYLNRAISGSNDLMQQASFAQAIRQVRESLEEAPPGVDVQVQASTTVPRNASIFVIARPVGGGMPYAVVKRPAVLVPFTVRLDELVSMSPARGLGQADEFEVLVRLSLSGAAMAQPGDWQWQSGPLKLSAETPPPGLDALLTPP